MDDDRDERWSDPASKKMQPKGAADRWDESYEREKQWPLKVLGLIG